MTKQKGMSKGDRANLTYERVKGIAGEIVRIGDLLQDMSATLATLTSLTLSTEEERMLVKQKMQELDNEQQS